MDRPCQAGTEGAGADAGSNPERSIVTFNAGHLPPLGPQANTGVGPYKTDDPGGKANSLFYQCLVELSEVGVRFWPRISEAASWKSTMRMAPRKAHFSRATGCGMRMPILDKGAELGTRERLTEEQK